MKLKFTTKYVLSIVLLSVMVFFEVELTNAQVDHKLWDDLITKVGDHYTLLAPSSWSDFQKKAANLVKLIPKGKSIPPNL